MSSGLYSGVSGLALGVGLYRNVSGLWGGASGLIDGFGGGSSSSALDIDFTTGTLDPRITFSRGTNATLIDSTGSITYAPANLLLRSQEFDNAAWTKASGGTGSAAVVTSNAALAPDGTITADQVVFNLNGGTTSSDWSWIVQAYTATAGTTYSSSVWVRTLSGTAKIILDSASTDSALYDVTTTWTRISGTRLDSVGGSRQLRIGLRGNNVASGQSNSATLLIWGAQLEPVTYQTTPAPYVATTSAAYYGPRFDYFPDTRFPRGLLLEGARTNLLLNSSIGGTSLATQNVTVAATPYTLSFYGSGQIVLSGTASATVTGTGAYPNRRTFTFTPTAGTLTLTVTGTVQYAQLEAGTWASSFIPTGGTAGTRNADSAAMVGTNFSSWYTNLTGTFAVGAETGFGTTTQTPSILMITDALGINYQTLYVDGTTRDIAYTGWYSDFGLDFISQSYNVDNLPARQYDLDSQYAFPWFIYGQAAAYSTNDFANSGNGNAPSLDTSGIVPVYMAQMTIGPNDGTLGYGGWFGWIRRLNYFGSRLSNTELQALSYAATASPATLELNFLQQQYYSGDVPYVTPTSLLTDFINQTYVVG